MVEIWRNGRPEGVQTVDEAVAWASNAVGFEAVPAPRTPGFGLEVSVIDAGGSSPADGPGAVVITLYTPRGSPGLWGIVVVQYNVAGLTPAVPEEVGRKVAVPAGQARSVRGAPGESILYWLELDSASFTVSFLEELEIPDLAMDAFVRRLARAAARR